MKLLAKLWARFKHPLNDVLKDPSLRESMLGVDRKRLVSDEKNKSDAGKILNYAKSYDYAVYAEELWKTMTFYINELSRRDLTDAESNYYRGCLAATKDALTISYKASQFIESLERTPPSFNVVRRESPAPGRN